MKKYMIILIIIFCSAQIYAVELDLNKAIKLALENNPQLLAAKEDMLSAKSNKWNSLTQFLPSLTTNAAYTIFDPHQTIGVGQTAENTKSYGFTVTQPLFQGGKIFFNAQMQHNNYKIQKENLRLVRLTTLTSVKEKYFNVLKNKEYLNITKLDLDNSITNLHIAKTKYEAGLISKADYLQIQSEKSSKEVDLLQVQNLYDTSIIDLANFLQIQEITKMSEINPKDYEDIMVVIQELDLEQIKNKSQKIVGAVLQRNPSIKIAALSVNISKKSVYMAGGNFLPSLNLSYNRNYNKYNYMNDFEEAGSLTLSASMPLFPILDNTTSLSQANHAYKKSRHNYTNIQDATELTVKSNFINMVSNAKKVKTSKIAMQQAQETYNQMQKRFSLGQLSANELLATQTMLLSTKNQYISSFYNFLISQSQLQQQLGYENLEKLNNIIKQ